MPFRVDALHYARLTLENSQHSAITSCKVVQTVPMTTELQVQRSVPN